MGEDTGNIVSWSRGVPPQARESRRPLSWQELAAERDRLSRLSLSEVAKVYQDALAKWQWQDYALPKAKYIQTVVTAWKVIWHARRKPPPRRDCIRYSGNWAIWIQLNDTCPRQLLPRKSMLRTVNTAVY